MEEELKNLGIELAQIAKKYKEDYIALSFVEGGVIGNTDPHDKNYIRIYMDKEEINERSEKNV